ncbi:hypothetical protein F4814DRAFT_408884 [Daldinia grandis]|nr:hypothetical protein F4814DRAFT_408884 [Daldinia grandis]
MAQPSFSKYEELLPELKLEIWRQASLSPGVHHFKVKPWVGTQGDDNGVLMVEITPASQISSDPSAWRNRGNIARVDKYSWDITKEFLKGPSIKELWRPQRGSEPKALVDCDRDLVCIRFYGHISNPYIGHFGDFPKLAGIRRVGVELKRKWTPSVMENWPQPTFHCLCRNPAHKTTEICTTALEDFIPYFPDIDVFYFIVKLTSQTIKSHTPAPRGEKRDRRGVIKVQHSQQYEFVPLRVKTPQVVSETYTKFRDIAERNKLETFEDMAYTYCEAREADTSCLTTHDEMWKAFSELKNLWDVAKTILPPIYPVREPELKVLVYTEAKKR